MRKELIRITSLSEEEVANLEDQEVLELFNQTIIPADESTAHERTATPTQLDLVAR